MPLRIVHCAASANGMPWLHGIVREQKRRGYDVRVAIPSKDGTVAPQLEADGVPYDVMSVSLPGRSSLLSAAMEALRIVRYLRRVRADVVHYHLFPSIIMGRIASWLADAPLRFSMIPGTLFLESPVLRDMEAGTAWADTRVIATCEKTRQLYLEQGVPAEKVAVTYYGLDPAAFDPARADPQRFRRDLGIDDDAPLVGFVAYFYAPLNNPAYAPAHLIGRGVKGHETLFDAIPGVLAEFPRAKFVLVGKGWGADGEEYERSLRQLVRDRGLADAVIFAGERSDIPDALAASDVALQCSLCENLGGSIEALMMGRPLIATRVGGLVDTVRHEETGLLFEPGDADGLRDSIVRLLRDRDLARRLGANGRRFMLERFTLQRTVDDLDALYAAGPRDGAYRLLATIGRLPRLPRALAGVVAKVQFARFRQLTPRRVVWALRGRFARLVGS